MQNAKILVVDDERLISLTISAKLRMEVSIPTPSTRRCRRSGKNRWHGK